MKLFVRRVGHALFPDGDASVAEFENLPQDKPLQADVTQPRNIKFHRLYFALCKRIGSGIGKDTDWVDRAFRTATGHYDIFRYGGEEKFVLRSIAFHKLDEIGFREFFNQCCEVAYTEWKIDPASVADLLLPSGQEEQKHQ